jgi:hypothetical protein
MCDFSENISVFFLTKNSHVRKINYIILNFDLFLDFKPLLQNGLIKLECELMKIKFLNWNQTYTIVMKAKLYFERQ